MLKCCRCLTVLLTTFYKREEQAQRISYLFVSAALSGGFGGLYEYPLYTPQNANNN